MEVICRNLCYDKKNNMMENEGNKVKKVYNNSSLKKYMKFCLCTIICVFLLDIYTNCESPTYSYSSIKNNNDRYVRILSETEPPMSLEEIMRTFDEDHLYSIRNYIECLRNAPYIDDPLWGSVVTDKRNNCLQHIKLLEMQESERRKQQEEENAKDIEEIRKKEKEYLMKELEEMDESDVEKAFRELQFIKLRDRTRPRKHVNETGESKETRIYEETKYNKITSEFRETENVKITEESKDREGNKVSGPYENSENSNVTSESEETKKLAEKEENEGEKLGENVNDGASENSEDPKKLTEQEENGTKESSEETKDDKPEENEKKADNKKKSKKKKKSFFQMLGCNFLCNKNIETDDEEETLVVKDDAKKKHKFLREANTEKNDNEKKDKLLGEGDKEDVKEKNDEQKDKVLGEGDKEDSEEESEEESDEEKNTSGLVHRRNCKKEKKYNNGELEEYYKEKQNEEYFDEEYIIQSKEYNTLNTFPNMALNEDFRREFHNILSIHEDTDLMELKRILYNLFLEYNPHMNNKQKAELDKKFSEMNVVHQILNYEERIRMYEENAARGRLNTVILDPIITFNVIFGDDTMFKFIDE
ncbi:hypothetical protein PFMC_05955 [Plasmodium falciparum CAMP/Malaysia]|uniref:J domain-containing protein n=1 Tax=Plasmodium falciparum (isolate Camp / Malaysia) TaxID=5835 RepID=A0A024WYL7_PLAFC|nr:hypothetical protein PFMC_05955 [Plasmodium falciparum CAMP/Malaysia]